METMLVLGLALLAVSIVLVMIEAFVPSGGVIGLAAGICAVIGVISLFRYSMVWGASGLLSVVVLGPMAFLWAVQMLPNSSIGRKLIGPAPDEIARDVQEDEIVGRDARLALIDARGVAVTDLRPIGLVEINGVRLDAMAEGPLIDRGQAIRVTSADGMQIRVRAAT